MKKQHRRCTALIAAAAMSIAFAGQAFAAVSGDINTDGAADVLDAQALTAYLTDSGELADAASADVNGDGRINAVDLTLLKRQLSTAAVQPIPSAGDNYVSAITYAASSVTLYNAAGEIVDPANAENVTVSDGTYVTVTKPTTDGTNNFGDINVDGECANGQLKVSVDKTAYADAEVVINMRGLTLSNSSDSPVYVEACGGECVITAKKDTVNTITDGTSYENADSSAGAIYSCDDLKFKGKGTLIVNGMCADGIVSKDDLKIWNGLITVNAVDDGIRGKDSVRIGDPDSTDYSGLSVSVTTQSGDGITSTNDSDTSKGFVRINGGTVSIKSYADGIQAEQAVEINGGDIDIYTYQGSNFTGSGSTGGSTGGWGGFGGGMDGNPNKTDISAKGIKAVGLYDAAGTTWQSAGNITITGGNLTIDSSDDAVHCGGDMSILGGVFTVKTADDGFHSDHSLTIGQGTATTFDDVQIYIGKCYEGIEGVTINQNSGTVFIVSGDDGYNAAGGADGSGSSNPGGWGQGGMSTSSGTLNLKGGLAVVNSASGDHDAFDSNGALTITGGYYCANGQEPMDYDGQFSNNGGSYLSMKSGNTQLSTRYSFVDSSGKVIVSFVSASGAGATTSNCTAYSGGTVSGGTAVLTNSPYELYFGGTLSGGTTVAAGSGSQNPGGPGTRP